MEVILGLYGNRVYREYDYHDGELFHVGEKLFYSLQSAVDYIVGNNSEPEDSPSEGKVLAHIPEYLEKPIMDIEARGLEVRGFIADDEDNRFQILSYSDEGMLSFISGKVAGIELTVLGKGNHVGQIGHTEKEYQEKYKLPSKEGLYRKKGTQPLTPWSEGMDMEGVSISVFDLSNGSPRVGDMIAHNPDDPTDRWLIAEKWFKNNYEEL